MVPTSHSPNRESDSTQLTVTFVTASFLNSIGTTGTRKTLPFRTCHSLWVAKLLPSPSTSTFPRPNTPQPCESNTPGKVSRPTRQSNQTKDACYSRCQPKSDLKYTTFFSLVDSTAGTTHPGQLENVFKLSSLSSRIKFCVEKTGRRNQQFYRHASRFTSRLSQSSFRGTVSASTTRP